MIVACGGVNGGYTLFIADHKLHYDYNFFNIERYAIVSPVLPTGKVDLKFNFIKTGMLKGTGELYVNGKKVAEGPIDKPFREPSRSARPSTSASTTARPCRTTTRQKDHFPFTGQIDKVTITLTCRTPTRPRRRPMR